MEVWFENPTMYQSILEYTKVRSNIRIYDWALMSDWSLCQVSLIKTTDHSSRVLRAWWPSPAPGGAWRPTRRSWRPPTRCWPGPPPSSTASSWRKPPPRIWTSWSPCQSRADGTHLSHFHYLACFIISLALLSHLLHHLICVNLTSLGSFNSHCSGTADWASRTTPPQPDCLRGWESGAWCLTLHRPPRKPWMTGG